MGSFAKVPLYEADDRFLARLLVRARVTDVEKVPQFIVYEDPDTIDGESWTIQCEVLQHKPQENAPPEEDPIPENVDLELGLPFDFFGLGQPINGPDDQADLDQRQAQNAWDPWPVEIQAQDQQMQEAQDPDPILNLNELPQPEEEVNLDLNQPPMNLDLGPVIINPIRPIQDGDFMEVNDLQDNEEVQYLLQHENEVFQLNPQEQEPMDVADDLHHNQNINIPVVPGSPINWLVDEVPLDQLVEPGDEGFPVENDLPPEQQAEEIQVEEIQMEQNNAPQAENQLYPNENEFFEAIIVENNQMAQTQGHQNNLQIGRVLLETEDRDPVWTQYKNAEATRLWAIGFSHQVIPRLCILTFLWPGQIFLQSCFCLPPILNG